MSLAHPPPLPASHLVTFFNDGVLRAAAVFAVLFCLTPPEGIPGFEMCLSARLSHAPCPGCGMTRCGSNLVRGNVTRAFQYHPLGLAVIPLIAAMGLLAVAPRGWRERARGALAAVPPRFARNVLWTLVGVFFVFGALRWVLVYCGRADFPLAL